jgi:hypothetical protein
MVFMPALHAPRMMLTLSEPRVSNFRYPIGNVSLGGFLDTFHDASVTKSYRAISMAVSTTYTQ